MKITMENLVQVKTEYTKTCEICLKILDDISACEILDMGLRDIIEILFIKSEVNTNPDSVVCTLCSSKLREAFDFKTMCIETEDILVPFIDSKNGEEVELSTIINSISHSNDYSQEMEYCRLCRKCSKIESMVPFNIFLRDPTVLAVFEKHIPEMSLDGIKNPFVCNSCKNIVYSFSSFLTIITDLNCGVCLDDHKLPCTSSFPAGNSKVQMEVSACNNDPNIDVKIEIDETHNEINNFLTAVTEMDTEISTQKSVDAKSNISSVPFYKKVFQDGKWIYVACSQDEACSTTIKGPKRIRIRLERKIYTCEICGFKTKNIQSHRLFHADLENIRNFKCSECSFVSKWLHSIKRHMQKHEAIAQNSTTRSKMYNCPYCSFTTLNKSVVRCHIKSSHDSEFKYFKCSHCDYWTNKKAPFDFHLKKHQRQNKEGLKKCNICDYWTRYNNHLRRHMAYHASIKQHDSPK